MLQSRMESVGIEIFMPIFVIICRIFEWKEICRFFLSFVIQHVYVLPLEIQLSRRKVWHPINRFNPAHIVPVPRQNLDFQRWYVMVSPLFYGDCSLYWYEWYCWPSLFKLSFHKDLVNSSMCATTHPKGKHTGRMGPKKNLPLRRR